ncbi:acetyl-CoA carboxylase biotin carboxyl carrier protein subunit [Lutimonas sp.]|jgi:biotin carboxyl carrier protein|uniref:acetyl-CoA carboxylase biotin carboxyl carrier protein subunit n=1 Tax=Lutimonas sp. TaxID=1872403 RepID=UPI003C73EDAD
MKNSSKALVNNIQEYSFSPKEVEQLDAIDQGNDHYHLIHKNKSLQVKVIERDFFNRTYSIRINAHVYTVKIHRPLDDLIKKMGYTTGSSKIIDSIKAPMPGIIVGLKVEKGQAVKEGDTLLILEAMKMENTILCPKNTVIKEIYVTVGDTVDKNKLLIDFE